MQPPALDQPTTDEVASVRQVHEILLGHGYTTERLSEATHLDGVNIADLKGKAALLHRTAGGTPLETLIRLFVLGVAVDVAALRAAVAPMDPDDWARLGLVVFDGDRALATVQIRCYEDLMVAYDFNRRPWTHDGLRSDYVMGISLSTLTLAGLTVRRPSRATLDLGTGSGFHALVAARHSERVVAADRSPRAVHMARFNALLNGLPHVTCVEGDLFEPVRDQRFDLVVSNPPFIISPDSTHYFLHSGLGADEVCRRIVRDAPAVLEEGGICQLLANWVIPVDGDWRTRLESWWEGSGCDGLVLERGRQTPEEYAATWIETVDTEPEALQPAFDRWLRYFEAQGIEAVGSGLITLRRNSGGSRPNWFRILEAPDQMTYPAGEEILRTIARRDFLEAASNNDLLDTPLRLAPGVQLVQEAVPEGGHWKVTASHLRRTKGFEYQGGIDADAARLLAAFDGRMPVRALLADLAPTMPPDQLERAGAVIRELVERGFAEPAAPA